MIRYVTAILVLSAYAASVPAKDVKDESGKCQITVPEGWTVDSPATRKKPAKNEDEMPAGTRAVAPGGKVIVSINEEDVKVPWNERKKYMAEILSAQKTLASDANKLWLELPAAWAAMFDGEKSTRKRGVWYIERLFGKSVCMTSLVFDPGDKAVAEQISGSIRSTK